jgi:RND superfamily putative drug exporter
LLGSVVLSFLGSLGISVLIFQNILGHDGIGSGVPIYMFLFLVALGVDYNIYIISRVKEESEKHGIKEGTKIAVSSTGGVITSAGVILAATFGALAILPLRDLLQLGFVVSFGVLLDTFFVRGFLVPSLVMLCGKFSWWPFNEKTSDIPPPFKADN